jgi:hypothetical protein
MTLVRGYLPADSVRRDPDPGAATTVVGNVRGRSAKSLPGPDIAPSERLDLTFIGVSKNGMRQCVVVLGFTCRSYGLGRWQANIPQPSTFSC